ncbi:DUF397 domain-containing protein [Streptomyces sp. NPDC004111]|uniref:DUF397 domain-containing protein n=1 Tax=Streptomyces sp. NPDC004111 TaxID=3364690 RepID=UPI00368022A3
MPMHPRVVRSSLSLPGAAWRRSSRSTGMNNCVETAPVGRGLTAVRDSKRTAGPALLFTPSSWSRFIGALREEQL